MKSLPLIALLCCAASLPPVPGVVKKMAHKSAEVERGAGAAALIAKTVVVPPLVLKQYYFFAATDTLVDSYSNAIESAYSSELSYTNTVTIANHKAVWSSTNVTLAWDPVDGSAGYTIYKGRASGVYPSSFSAGTNLTLTVPLPGPALTNYVVTVTGSNVQSAPSIYGPWTDQPWNTITFTNPPGMQFFRGQGMSIQGVWQ